MGSRRGWASDDSERLRRVGGPVPHFGKQDLVGGRRAGQGHGWTQSRQCRHRAGCGSGRAGKEGREPRTGDAGPLTGDMRLT